MKKFLFLDCDSTLCAIEGVDELAALRGPEVEQQVIELTNHAMDGSIPIDQIFSNRLDLIQPSQDMCEAVGKMYIDRLSPHAEKTINLLRERDWEPIIISGGFTQVIKPVADYLNIAKCYAVDLILTDEGSYHSFDPESPTARNGGKPEIIQSFIRDIPSAKTVMLGDGISDLETKSVVDLFIGFGGVISREAVKSQATAFISDFSELPQVLEDYLPD